MALHSEQELIETLFVQKRSMRERLRAVNELAGVRQVVSELFTTRPLGLSPVGVKG